MRLLPPDPAPAPLLRGSWILNLYPAAGEAGGCFVRARSVRTIGPSSPDPDRAEAEAGRRAKGKIRRYCAANGLNRFATLTYGGDGCLEPFQLREDVGEFFRGLRRSLNAPFAYLWTAELHPGGHGLHVHFAVGRFVKQTLIRDVWGRGLVHIKLIGDLPTGSGSLEEARQSGRYLGKYASKSMEEGRPKGLHRYEVAQGFQPTAIRVEGRSANEVIGAASDHMGHHPSSVWRSDEVENWSGPPAVSVRWGRAG